MLISHSSLLQGLPAIENFIFAGRSIFTLVSTKTRNRYTYKVNKWERYNKEFWFSSVYFGNQYLYFAHFRKIEGRFSLTMAPPQKARYNPMNEEHNKSIRAFKWYMMQVIDRRYEMAAKVEFWHVGRCARCGKPLTDPESILRGIGPHCLKQMALKSSN